MSAQWIKLTGKDGADTFVNMATVTMMCPHKHLTRIWFLGARDDHVDVFESPVEIVVSLHQQLARQFETLPPPPPAATVSTPPAQPAPSIRPAPKFAPEPLAVPLSTPARNVAPPAPSRSSMNIVAAKLARAAAIKVSRAPIASLADDRHELPKVSETVAEQRGQRARRRASAILDERREQLARKLEALQREKDFE